MYSINIISDWGTGALSSSQSLICFLLFKLILFTKYYTVKLNFNTYPYSFYSPLPSPRSVTPKISWCPPLCSHILSPAYHLTVPLTCCSSPQCYLVRMPCQWPRSLCDPLIVAAFSGHCAFEIPHQGWVLQKSISFCCRVGLPVWMHHHLLT